VADGEVGLFTAQAEALVSSGPRGFDISGKVLPAEGLRGKSTFGDSLSGEMFFAGEAEEISWGALHENSQINNKR
jgi:hypothetical protein